VPIACSTLGGQRGTAPSKEPQTAQARIASVSVKETIILLRYYKYLEGGGQEDWGQTLSSGDQ